MTGWPNAAIVILALPAATAALLAALPSYRLSAALNVGSAFVTFLASVSLLVAAPQPNAYILVDDLNVVFIVLNTFVGFTASVFSATYIAHEIETGRLTPTHLRFYHAMYQFLLFSMNLALIANNIGLMWVAIEFATLTTVLMVGIYRTHGGDRGGVEIFHPRQRRHRARPLRHDPRLYGRPAGRRRGRPGHAVDEPDRTCGGVRSVAAQSRLRLPAARLRHESGPCAAARLAARRARRRSDADLGRAFRPPAQCRALRRAALQAAARRQRARARAGAADGDAGPHLARLRRLHALPPARREAHVRLFLDRAHGRDRVRLRDRRAARQFRRAPAHGDAQPDQIGDLLHRRPDRPGQGHAADRRHSRPDRHPSAARLEPRVRRLRHRRPAADGRVHERVPHRQLHLRTRAVAGAAARLRPSRRARRPRPAPAGHGLRRADRFDRAGQGLRRCRSSPISPWC